MTDRLSTAELAEFDQQWRDVERVLDALVGMYRELTDGPDASREVDLICFAAALPDLIRAQDCGALLACAVARLAARDGAP